MTFYLRLAADWLNLIALLFALTALVLSLSRSRFVVTSLVAFLIALIAEPSPRLTFFFHCHILSFPLW